MGARIARRVRDKDVVGVGGGHYHDLHAVRRVRGRLATTPLDNARFQARREPRASHQDIS
jgi:hypothetical protein